MISVFGTIIGGICGYLVLIVTLRLFSLEGSIFALPFLLLIPGGLVFGLGLSWHLFPSPEMLVRQQKSRIQRLEDNAKRKNYRWRAWEVVRCLGNDGLVSDGDLEIQIDETENEDNRYTYTTISFAGQEVYNEYSRSGTHGYDRYGERFKYSSDDDYSSYNYDKIKKYIPGTWERRFAELERQVLKQEKAAESDLAKKVAESTKERFGR